jgi:arylsulfotransferase ASST
MRFPLARGVLAASALLCAACGQDSSPIHAAENQTPGPARGTTVSQELQHLAGLGYVDFAEEEADETGVVDFDRERSSPGYNLYNSLAHGMSGLINMRGDVVNTWQLEGSNSADRCELLPDGDLLVISRPSQASEDGSGCALLRLGWNGELRWRRAVGAHHDLRVLPNGNIAVLTARNRDLPQVHPTIPTRDEHILLLSPEGEELADYSLWDMASSNPAQLSRFVAHFKKRYREDTWLGFADVFHANSVELMDRPDLQRSGEVYGPLKYLVSMRAQDAIAIFDGETDALIWSWGPGQLQGPHDARLLANGNILLFDNGARGRGYSRILECDPQTKTIVWEYSAPQPSDFFSKTRGTAQHLPNGNILIGDSNRGQAFEIDRSGRVVWRFINPNCNDRGQPGTLRIRRYEPRFIQPILAAKTR